jgi:hypothetical protein
MRLQPWLWRPPTAQPTDVRLPTCAARVCAPTYTQADIPTSTFVSQQALNELMMRQKEGERGRCMWTPVMMMFEILNALFVQKIIYIAVTTPLLQSILPSQAHQALVHHLINRLSHLP